jgi:hypothetical protein
MTDVKDLDFSNIHQILQQNSMPKAGESLNLADSATHTMSKLDTLFVTAKLSLLLGMGSSDSVRTYSDKFRTNFSATWSGGDLSQLRTSAPESRSAYKSDI